MLLIVPITVAQEKPKEPANTKDTFEDVLKELMGQLKKAADLLKTVKDEKAAKEVKPALTKIGEEMQKLTQRGQKLGQPTKEQEEALEKKFKSELETITTAFQGEAVRLSKETWGKDLLEAFRPSTPKPPTPPAPPKPPEKK